MRSALVHAPIDVSALIAEVSGARNGAIVVFLGTVREVNDGRAVTGIDYRAYEAMAERELAAIAGEAAERWGSPDVVVEHRLGALTLGEVSVAIVAAHPRRAPAFEVGRFVIEELKRRVPVWKLEHYVDGTREWVGSTAIGPEASGVGRGPLGESR